MSPSLIGVLGVVVLFALLILRVPVWISLVLVGFFGNAIALGWPGAFALLGTAPFDVASSYSLSVVPLFIQAGLDGVPLTVHGDGMQSRDFTYIDNVVQANLRAMEAPAAAGEAFNIACGSRYTLMDIVHAIERELGHPLTCKHTPPRAGDVRHTLADIATRDDVSRYIL